MGIGEQLEQALESVHLKRRDVETADNTLAYNRLTIFESKLVHNKLIGVNKTNLEKVGEILMTELNLTEFFNPAFEEEIGKKVRELFQFLPLTSERKVELEKSIIPMGICGSLFGLIFGINNDDGTFDIAYAIHQHQHEVPGGAFSLKSIKPIKETYSKHQALLAFKQENIIKEISYV